MGIKAKDAVINSLLKELAVRDVSQLIKDSLITEILSRLSDFSAEVKHFEAKYHKRFDEFSKEYETNEEDFKKYDDLMAWEFALQGKQYWEKKLKEAKRVL
jgi:hypothetical protein